VSGPMWRCSSVIKALAEPHHLIVALAFGIEIRSAFAAAHGQRGERILEHLLECKEFQNAEVDRGMEAQAAFVWSDGAVHLDAEATVDFNIALIIRPRHTGTSARAPVRRCDPKCGLTDIRDVLPELTGENQTLPAPPDETQVRLGSWL